MLNTAVSRNWILIVFFSFAGLGFYRDASANAYLTTKGLSSLEERIKQEEKSESLKVTIASVQKKGTFFKNQAAIRVEMLLQDTPTHVVRAEKTYQLTYRFYSGWQLGSELSSVN